MASQLGAWSEEAFVTITKYAAGGGTDYDFKSITETMDFDIGDKGIEQFPTVGGGRIIKKVPQELSTITLELYPIGNDPAALTGLGQYFTGSTVDTTSPKVSSVSRLRGFFRIAVLWTEDTTPTNAAAQVAFSNKAYRFICAHAYFTGYKQEFKDGILKATAQFQFPSFNKNGIAMYQDQEGAGTLTTGAELATLNSYGSTNYPLDASAALTF